MAGPHRSVGAASGREMEESVSGFKSFAHFLATVATGGTSRHKTARAQRFVFRHRKAHRRVIPDILEAQREHEAACDRRFLAARRTAERDKRKHVHPKHRRDR